MFGFPAKKHIRKQRRIYSHAGAAGGGPAEPPGEGPELDVAPGAGRHWGDRRMWGSFAAGWGHWAVGIGGSYPDPHLGFGGKLTSSIPSTKLGPPGMFPQPPPASNKGGWTNQARPASCPPAAPQSNDDRSNNKKSINIYSIQLFSIHTVHRVTPPRRSAVQSCCYSTLQLRICQ